MRLRMNLNEIADLLQPFLESDSISAKKLTQIAAYLELLLKWNAKINLSAIRSPEEIVTRHFGESFFAARHLLSGEGLAASAIDIGSGAGFPGLPMKVWSPSLGLTMIESNGRKATFLREVSRALELSGVEIASKRAEDLEVRTDLVTLRAVERFESILPTAARLMNSEGTLALLIGGSQAETAKKLLPSLKWKDPMRIPLSRSRVLLVGRPT
jgi:16S rRNA (guanine527-N7)-methyltransferase